MKMIWSFIALMFFATNVGATLVQQDWVSGSGDGLITHDTSLGGLDWLDWSVTDGMSVDEVTTQLGAGGGSTKDFATRLPDSRPAR